MFYAELNMIFTEIQFALFILLTGVRTAKYIIPIICPVLFIEYSAFLFLESCVDRIRGIFAIPKPIHTRSADEQIVERSGSVSGLGSALLVDILVDIGEEENTDLKIKEHWHIVQDHLGKWHIGLVFEAIGVDNYIVFCVDVLVSASLFFQFPMEAAKSYLLEVAEEDENSVILAADLHHNICGSAFQIGNIYDLPDLPLIIKTHWICIIQRTWKRIYYTRLKLRGNLKTQRQFELSGNYGYLGGGLRGMLSAYAK